MQRLIVESSLAPRTEFFIVRPPRFPQPFVSPESESVFPDLRQCRPDNQAVRFFSVPRIAQVIQRGQEFPSGQIARCAEDDKDVWLNGWFQHR
jgi:hypothetical protein